MCGIAGLWLSDAQRIDAESCLDAMLARMEHRGPDDAGVWFDRRADVMLGHRRLAVIDLSPLAHQPMVSEDEQLAVVFNGEIYNFAELRRELVARGCRFSSESDTEVLLHGYRTWGERLVDRLVGMFAFAIWDATGETLFLARDRAGEKPLYYARGPWGFAFASELNALAALPGVSTEIDRDALALYLHYQAVPAPYSIYRDARKLPPGHAMRVRREETKSWRYWDPVAFATGPRLRIDEHDALTELDTLLRTAVRGQMIADVPLGAFLSGGIDSTAVVSAMVEVSATSVKTFTIGFDVERFDESPHAGAVAAHLGTDHTVEMLTERAALDIIPMVPRMYGEPFADSSALPTYLVSRTARRKVTVSLSGDGGDEAFGGYPRYRYLELGAHLTRVLGPAGGWLAPVLSRFPGKVRRGAPLLALPVQEIYRRLLTIFGPDEVRALAGHLPSPDGFDAAWQAASRRPVRQRAMLTDLLTYLPDAILTKVDRAAMAVSLETRAPLLDHRILEFALQLPPALVQNKRLLRHWLYRRVPRALVDRPKQGFGVPIARWFRGALRDTMLDVLTAARMQSVGVTEYSLVKRLIGEHLSATADHSSRLWTLLVLGLWAESRNEHLRAGPTPAYVRRETAGSVEC